MLAEYGSRALKCFSFTDLHPSNGTSTVDPVSANRDHFTSRESGCLIYLQPCFAAQALVILGQRFVFNRVLGGELFSFSDMSASNSAPLHRSNGTSISVSPWIPRKIL
jgi:hypothetical protein